MDFEQQFKLGHLLLDERKCRSCGKRKNLVDSFYRICTQKNLITGKAPTPDDLADIKFPPSLKT